MISLVLTRFRPDRPSGGAALRNWQNIQALRRLGPVDVLSIGAEATGEDVPGIRRWMAFSFSHLSAARSKSARVAARLWPLRPGCHPSIAAYDFADVRTALRASLAEASYGVAV